MKILIGYDGSECADAALDDLTQAALPPTGEAHILSVAEVWLPPPPPSAYEIIEEARSANSPAELQRDFGKHCAAASGKRLHGTLLSEARRGKRNVSLAPRLLEARFN